MSPKEPEREECSVCGRKRVVAQRSQGLGHTLTWCSACMIRRRCVDVVGDLSEKALNQALKALCELRTRYPTGEVQGLTAEGVQRLRDDGLIR